jgi:hypothetical protein
MQSDGRPTLRKTGRYKGMVFNEGAGKRPAKNGSIGSYEFEWEISDRHIGTRAI